MKKSIAILLSVLYLVSFSGMLLGLECSNHHSLLVGADASKITCKVPGNNQQNNSHPFLSICKLVEVHKEVLVTGHAKTFRSSLVTLVSTNHVFSSPAVQFIEQVHQPVLNAPHKIFLQNCVLLI